jgi:peptidoglycan-associated lipoprotein
MNFKLLFSLLFVSLSWVAQAQKNYVKEANEIYRDEKYCEGAEKCAFAYTKIVKKGASALKLKGDMAFKTAECFRQTENMKSAHEWYEKAILLKYHEVEPLVLLYNGEMLRIMGDFKKAKENFEAYKSVVPDDTRALVGLKSCEMHEEFKVNKTKHIVSNEEKLNGKGYEMAPMFGDKKNVQMVYSISKSDKSGSVDPRTCESYMDLWIAELDKNGNWMAPKAFPDPGINTDDNEGTVCFDGRGKKMFFTRCPNVKKQNLGCDIWMSELSGKNWGMPTKLILKSSDSISVGHPCVSDDGKHLVFASDLPGGFGGKDLWYTTYDKKSDSWTAPVNMGSGINTPGNELFPTLALNGDLFYASDGLPGVGGLDIFRAAKVGDENKWENPTNLGMPINSESNDYALIEHTDKKGYFTSERQVGKGDSKADIWNYVMPPNLFDLTVTVGEIGDMTKKKRVADLTVYVVGSNGEKWEGVTNADGKVFWDKKSDASRYIKQDVSYSVNLGTKGGFKENKKVEKFTTVGLNYNQSFFIDMQMVPEKVFRLPEVRYPFNQWSLLVDSTINSKDSLMYVYNLLNEYPTMVLELSSHTDSRGDNEYNRILADNRAKECYRFLVDEKGIDPRRIVPIGRGESQPRVVFKRGNEWFETMPEDKTGVETIVLNEAYINKFKADKALFEKLHQFNRRTEGRVITMEFDEKTAPAASPNYKVFLPLKKGKK